jgi:hypothetical protein
MMATNAVVKDTHIVVSGLSYFRGAAEGIKLGTFGIKRTPLFGENFLEAQNVIPASKLVVKNPITFGIDFTSSNDTAIKAGLKVAGVSLSVDAALKGLHSGSLKLTKLEMNLEEVTRAVNALPNVLDELRSFGGRARVAQAIFVVLEAQLADTFTRGGTISFATNKAGELNATVSSQASGTIAVTLEKGTTFAYLLCEPHWGPQQKSVELFQTDQWGPA